MSSIDDKKVQILGKSEMGPAKPSIDPAPEWLVNLRRSNYRKGSYVSGDGFGVVFTDRESDVLIVSWDNLSSAGDDAIDRLPWGYSFVAKNGWSQLGVMTFNPDWFRNDDLIDHMISLRDSGFFQRFRRVVMNGTSMGAYAASAFASLAPGCTVVAFSPQSTLKTDLVPWESRFASGRRADWSGAFADAAEESRTAERVFLIYDPRFVPDVKHVDRFTDVNVTRLKARYSDHKTALFLRRAGLLSSVVKAAVAGTLSEPEFYRIYRGGRALQWYKHAVMRRLIEDGRQRHLPRFAEAMRAMQNEPLARSAMARAVELGGAEAPGHTATATGPITKVSQSTRTMGPHERRLAERAAAKAATANFGTDIAPPPTSTISAPPPLDRHISEHGDIIANLYQSDPNLSPLETSSPLPWQDIQRQRSRIRILQKIAQERTTKLAQ